MSVTLGAAADVQSGRARTIIMLALVAGTVAGLAAGGSGAEATTDVELAHLLRAMAALKLLFVIAATAAIWWRLQATVRPSLLAAYAGAVAATAAGPGQIWFMTNLILASVLLHAGLAALVVLLWRDSATTRLLDAAIQDRRRRLRG